MSKIGYLGPVGTYSEIACREYEYRNTQTGFVRTPKSTFFDIFEALQSNELDYAIVPIENSIQGAVTLPIDLMIKHPNLHIVSEVVIPIKNELLALPDCDPKSIETILSHEQPLAQCHDKLHLLFPNAALVPINSTASGVMKLTTENAMFSDDRLKTAIIGHAQLAKTHGLKILVDSMNDFPNNQTRFWVLSKSDTSPTGNDKTSLVFTLEKDRSGGLSQVLTTYSERKINLTQISSRPSKTALGEYVFWIDIEGHQKDPKVAEALASTQQQSGYFRCLGSYERDPLC